MNIDKFVELFAEQFDDTPKSEFNPDTDFKKLGEWDSLTALAVIAMVDEEMEKRITGSDIRNCTTISELFDLANTH